MHLKQAPHVGALFCRTILPRSASPAFGPLRIRRGTACPSMACPAIGREASIPFLSMDFIFIHRSRK